MKTCEYCKSKHNGSYGSGRFCCNKCARSFSTKEKRIEINQKVSQTLKEKSFRGELHKGIPFKKGYDWRRELIPHEKGFKHSEETKQKIKKSLLETNQEKLEKKLKTTPFEKLCKYLRKRVLIKERGHKCEKCKNTHWLKMIITLELEHIDGNNQNNKKENLLLLCPNCHSYTPTWRRNKNSKKVKLLIKNFIPKNQMVPVAGFEPVIT